VSDLVRTLVSAADGIAWVAVLWAIVVFILRGRLGLYGSRLILFSSILLVYFYINTSNLLENTGISETFNMLEDSAELLGPLLFLLFFYSYERLGLVRELRRTVKAHESALLQLSTAKERLFGLLNTVPDPVFVVTTSGAVTFANDSFRRTFLRREDADAEFKPRPISETPPTVQSLVAKCPTRELVVRREAVTRTINLPHMGFAGVVLQINALPLRSAEGEVTEGFYHIHDITAESRMLQSLAQERKAQSVSNLASGIAHEFNNILGGIGGVAQLVETSQLTEDEVRDYMGKINELVVRGTGLIQQLSAVSKQRERGAFTTLDTLLSELDRRVDQLLPPGIRLRVKQAEGLHPASVSREELEIALSNIIANAAEASLPGGTVLVDAENFTYSQDALPDVLVPLTSRYVRITIVDSGRGVHNEDRERIFDPFYTTKETRKGMGLPVARTVIEDHGGVLRLEKTDELGSVFAVYLPYYGATGDETTGK
jgi:two-component system cell cycle sensor histidine kinase/response regulator CckA